MWVFYFLAAAVVALDQLTKHWVAANMEVGERIELVEPYIALQSHRNRGAAWGMLQDQQWLFAVVFLVVSAGIVYYFHKHARGHLVMGTALMLLLGGAIGNSVDRLRAGEVVDFVALLIPVVRYRFPIFNVADVALTAGVILLLIATFREERGQRKVTS